MSARERMEVAIALAIALGAGVGVGVYAWRGRAVARAEPAASAPQATAAPTPMTSAMATAMPAASTIGGRELPPLRPVYRVQGGVTELARVELQPSAQQWARGLRAAVCACQDAACATRVQERFARNLGGLDFASGDRAATQRELAEASACTSRLADARDPG